jgi:hypothetical protein
VVAVAVERHFVVVVVIVVVVVVVVVLVVSLYSLYYSTVFNHRTFDLIVVVVVVQKWIQSVVLVVADVIFMLRYFFVGRRPSTYDFHKKGLNDVRCNDVAGGRRLQINK